jgi:hypothetical protein
MIRSHWLQGSGMLAACLSLLSCGAPAHAGLVITPTFGSSITSDPNAAAIEGVINSAIAVYQGKFTDPITVTIEFNEMTSGLGASTTGFYNVPYQSYLTALTADAKSAADATALAHLPAGPNNPVNGDANINVKSANARAVGLPGSFPGFVDGTFDGAIGLNTHITDVGSPGTTGQFSLLATVEHEIDEVLGLGSALPSVPLGTIFPEDLYRYDSSGFRSFTTSSNAQAFFSIDGMTRLAQFDNQNDGGDFGDWQSNPLPNGVQPQVQDAFASQGAHPTLGDNEITALDVIGYDLAQAVVTPEPASLTLVATGTLLLAGYRLRRRARPVA